MGIMVPLETLLGGIFLCPGMHLFFSNTRKDADLDIVYICAAKKALETTFKPGMVAHCMCNLPPITGNASEDVGRKTNLVTVNPSIITLKYKNLNEKKERFLKDISNYGDTFLLLPAFSYRVNTGISFKVYQTLKESKVRQKVLFFHPRYLRHLALFWKTKGVTAYRLSTGLMIASIAIELCENVKLYGFWPFSKTVEKIPLSHHYYDNKLPKRGFHQMPKEYSQMLQLHMGGVVKLHFGKCEMP
ncbi:unknown_gene_2586 [Phodopus roborovskii]|uniref:Unknown_gene_2586 protein n=1 Tax=Phodopus roborovskii TaxID=109678 RepID=A0AAV0A9E4_PHORO|nr:unknown_gene_2586 [Phodopus roborovskii]